MFLLGPPDDLMFMAETIFSDIPADLDSLGDIEEFPWTQWSDRVPDALDEWLTLTSGVVVRPLLGGLDD
jgi:hypothetical protein